MWFHTQFFVVFVFAAYRITSAQEDVHEGTSCTLENGSEGVCILLPNCPSALQNVLSGNRPKACSYSGFTPVVCCSQPPPRSNETSVSAAPPVKPIPEPSPSAGRISQKKCEEYGRAVFRLESSFIPGERINTSLCEESIGTPFIINGTPAVPKEFPHMAAIGYDTKAGRRWLCGGSLISEKFILTAAHCLDDHSRDGASFPRYVRLGEVDVSSDEESVIQEYGVKKMYKYPDYKAPIKYHDIGLIELDKNAEFDAYVRPACLQTERDDFASDSYVIGWGKTDYYQYQRPSGGAWSQKLLKAKLQHSPHDYCKAKFDGLPKESRHRVLANGIIDDWMLCFGDKEGKMDACLGDSGGPLQYRKKSPFCTYSILGISSFGNKCAKPDFPGIYTRVSNYVPWIESIVWPSETA